MGYDRYRVSDLTPDTIARLNSLSEGRKIEVMCLSGNVEYRILAYPENDILEYEYGARYYYDNDYYFINYSRLDNSYFDADGRFSYRSGSVEALLLDESAVAELETVTKNTYTFTSNFFVQKGEGDFVMPEYPTPDSYERTARAIAVSVITLILCGYVPAILTTLFSLRAAIKRKKQDGCIGIYIIIASGVLWLVASIIATLILYIK